MIKIENFKNVLEKLGFEHKFDIYTKNFNEFKTKLEVNFKNEKLIYPESDGLKVNDKTTSNFTSAENFVVFECVCKLLTQGYNPKHIELEPKWQVGHGASGGKADILIKDNDEKTLLIIECKTAGVEFKKAWDTTQIKPTQLFSYAQQDRDTKFIALYASDFVDDEIKSNYYLISLADDNKRLFENKALKSYSDANTVENIYNVWSETYKKEFKTNGIFEENKAYYIGVEKTNINDLKIVSSNDIKGKYNEFATIMRQHNIGGAERAFNVLVNLFLCKIIDENKNIKNEKSGLEFYWKGISYDDAFALQDRLQELYKVGMFDFLNEEITYISDKAIDDMFKIIDLDSLKVDVKSKFREQKFFTNNDFSFLDVHSEELFYKNFEVLLKVVEMFQDIRLTGVEDNQFLGDMFEGFLDNGVKQSEGQFFTPMPIVKFIINSLPLDDIQKTHNEPKAIDFACGAGHFLNEVAKVFTTNEVVGIEKEYRLSKVAKVSALMYGQENINIVYNDALTKNEEIQNDTFSVLVANPPYSVKGFLETLSKDDIETYELTKTIEEKSFTANNSIECFFIEKAKQILSAGGVTGIVLPSSILNKGDGKNTYVGMREILIKYFEIIAIAEFGSGTFGKTETHTVTLFLRRRDDTQNIVGRYKDFINNLFVKNKNTQKLFTDKNLIKDYCTHIDIQQEIYLSMFEKKLNQELFKHETFTEYEAEFLKLTVTKNRKIKAYYKALTKEKKEAKEALELLKYIKDIESDKLYYFCLASETKKEVLIIKSPSDGKENKKFLGYGWSGRKGNEGIQYSGGTLNNIKTPLYNPNDKGDTSKINTLITKNFIQDNIDIPQELENFVSKARLVDMLDFSRKDFNKAINLVPKKEIRLLSTKYESIDLDILLEKVKGNTTKIAKDEIQKIGKFPVITQEQNNLIAGYSDLKSTITDLPLVMFGDHSCTFKYIDFQFIRGADGTQLLKFNEDKILTKYFYYLSNILEITNQDKYERHMKYLKSNKIPLPPLDIQKEIINECEEIDKEVEKENQNIEIFKSEIANEIKIGSSNLSSIQLSDIAESISSGLTPLRSNSKFWSDGTVPWLKTEQLNDKYIYDTNEKISQIALEETSIKINKKNTLSIAMYGEGRTRGSVAILKNEMTTNQACCNVYLDEKKASYEYVYCYLKTQYQNLRSLSSGVRQNLNTTHIKNYKIPLPTLEVQKEIVAKIAIIEEKISMSRIIVDTASSKKQAILRKYL